MGEKIVYAPTKTGETRIRKKERVSFITFPALDKFEGRIVNAFSTRKGGFSSGIYKSMNLGLGNDDSRDNILFNYMEFSKAIGINYNNIVISNQQHTTNIRIATEEDRGKGVVRERDYDSVDGFITNEPGVALCLLFADCVPVYLYDPEHEAIGLLHSGWKGTVGEISGKAIKMMAKEYGSRPEALIACIGPSICKDCYEVSSDLFTAFSKVFPAEEMEKIFEPGKDEEHFQLDLWQAIRFTLLRAGVLPENIHTTDLCTNHNPELLFSHRFTKGRRGNLAAVLMLLPEPPEDPELFKNFLPEFRPRR